MCIRNMREKGRVSDWDQKFAFSSDRLLISLNLEIQHLLRKEDCVCGPHVVVRYKHSIIPKCQSSCCPMLESTPLFPIKTHQQLFQHSIMHVLLKPILSKHRELQVSHFLYSFSHYQEKSKNTVSTSPGDSKNSMNSSTSRKEKCFSLPRTVALEPLGEWADAKHSSRHLIFLLLNWRNLCQSLTKNLQVT